MKKIKFAVYCKRISIKIKTFHNNFYLFTCCFCKKKRIPYFAISTSIEEGAQSALFPSSYTC